MKIKAGDIIQSEFGIGPLICATEQWIIQDIGKRKREEVALLRSENWISVPVEIGVDIAGHTTTEI